MILIGGTLILLACIGLVFMVWSAVASVLFPWIDRKREQRVVYPTLPMDDILNGKADDDDRAQR
jgi:hypothetical protein